jgi:hypothetical protein
MTILIAAANIASLSAASAAELRDQIAAAHGCHIAPTAAEGYVGALEADRDMTPDLWAAAERAAHDEMLRAGCARRLPQEAEALALKGAPRALQQLRDKTPAEISDWLRDSITREGWGDIPACFAWARGHAKTSATAALLLARCDHHGLTARLA